MATYPDWVKKYKEKGTEVRYLGGKYRLYKISSKWDAEKKRARKITEKYLGTITESGLIGPNSRDEETIIRELNIKDYGAYELVRQLNEDVVEGLKKRFAQDWEVIWAATMFRLVHQAPIKRWEHFAQHAFLDGLSGATLKLGGKAVSSWLQGLGSRRAGMVELLGSFSSSAEYLLIDSTDVSSHSRQLGINHVGYKAEQDYDPHVRLMSIFNYDERLPVYYRLLPGNIRDVSAMQRCLEEFDRKEVTVVADKGFYSQANVESLEAEGIRYILPLRRNSVLIDQAALGQEAKRGFEGYFRFEGRLIWYSAKRIVQGKQAVYVFLDESLKVREQRDYLDRVESETQGYTMEGFWEKEPRMGMIALLTNLSELSAQQLYERYKMRGAIEQVFDTFKNLLQADRSYMRNEQALESWMFINFLALICYYRIYNLLVKKDLLKKYSVADLLIYSQQVRKINIRNQWHTAEYPKKLALLFEKLGLPIT